MKCFDWYLDGVIYKSKVCLAHRLGGTASGATTSGGPTGLFFLQLSEQYLTSSKFFHFARSCMIRLQVTQYLKRFQTPESNTRGKSCGKRYSTVSVPSVFAYF